MWNKESECKSNKTDNQKKKINKVVEKIKEKFKQINLFISQNKVYVKRNCDFYYIRKISTEYNYISFIYTLELNGIVINKSSGRDKIINEKTLNQQTSLSSILFCCSLRNSIGEYTVRDCIFAGRLNSAPHLQHFIHAHNSIKFVFFISSPFIVGPSQVNRGVHSENTLLWSLFWCELIKLP